MSLTDDVRAAYLRSFAHREDVTGTTDVDETDVLRFELDQIWATLGLIAERGEGEDGVRAGAK